jgi:general secretion pathway protein K
VKNFKKASAGVYVKDVSRNERGGVALVLVIWVLVVLVAIVGEFSYSMRTEINITRNFKEEEEAYQLALAGIEHAKYEILSVKDNAVVYINEDEMLAFDNLLAFEEEKEIIRSGTLDSGKFEYILEDESGKLNINSVNDSTRGQLEKIFTDSGVEVEDVDTIVDSILDWIDTNEEHHLNGAEEDYYRSLDRPYSSKDGSMDSIDELLLVKGMNRDILYGSKQKRGDAEENEDMTYEGVIKYLTAFDLKKSIGTSAPAQDSWKININTASPLVLETVLGPEAANNILRQREEGPILNPQSNGMVSSDIFSIISTGTNADSTIKRSIKMTVMKINNKLEILYWNDNFIG